MRRKIIFVKTLNKTQEVLKTQSRKKQSTENELKMEGEERKKEKKSRKYILTIINGKSTIRAT